MKWLLFTVFPIVFCGCGVSLDSTQTITIEMYGVSVTPTGAAGTSDPLYQNYTLAAVSFIDADGGTATLSSAEDLVETKVVNRPIIIFNKDISGLAGNTYAQLTVQFNAAVTGGSKVNDTGSFTMTSDTVTLAKEITVETGKSQTYYLQIQWRSTVDDNGTMSVPEFVLVDEI